MANLPTRLEDLIAKTERKITVQRARLETHPSDGVVAEIIRRGLAMLRMDLDIYRATQKVMESTERLMDATENI